MTAMPGGGDYVALPELGSARVRYAQTGPVIQWFAAKTTGEKLNLVFENIADEDGHVEKVKHIGGRDWLVFWSKQVQR